MSLHDWSKEDLIHEVEALRSRLEKYESASPRPRPSASLAESASQHHARLVGPSESVSPQLGGALAEGGKPADTSASPQGPSLESIAQENLRMLETLVESIDEAVMITQGEPLTSPGPTLLYVNRAFTRTTGYTPEEAIGRTPRMLQGKNTDPAAILALRTALQQGVPYRGQMQNYRKDGSTYWCDLHVLPHRNAEGVITHFIGFQTDITEIRGVTHDLELFRTLVEQSDEGVLVVQASDSGAPPIIYANSALEQITGYERHELIGKTPGDFAREGQGCPIEDTLLECIRKNDSVGRQALYRHRSGTEHWVEILVFPLRDRSGANSHFIVHLTDISESRATMLALQRSEERLLEAQQIGRIGSWEYSTSTGTLWWSEELYHMLDVPKAHPLAWERLKIEHQLDERFELKNLLRLAEMDQLPDAIETKMRTMRGDFVDVQIRMWAESEPGGAGMRICGTTQDITQQHRTEEALRNAKEAAESANRTKSLFLGVMSHELRTPLNSIMGLTDLLLDQDVDPQHGEYLKLISRASESLLAIIEDILTYAQSEPGQLQLKSLPFSPRELLDSVFHSLAPNFRNKGLEIQQVLDPKLPGNILGDRIRLRQIMTNLVNNALKFTETGGVLSQVHYLPDQQCMRIMVSDTGEGIPEEFRERMFQPFSQADSTSTRKHGGAGLGLAICKRLLDLMGGTIELESETGRGTTFTLMIPVQVLPDEPGATTEQEEASEKRKPQFGKEFASRFPMRLMVVEDDPMNRRLIRVLLNSLGYTFIEANDGEAALRLSAEHPVDVMLLDIQMPGLNGYETCEQLRAMKLPGAQPFVVALTANAMLGDREKCLEAGMDDYMAKPIRLQQLAAKLVEAHATVQERL